MVFLLANFNVLEDSRKVINGSHNDTYIGIHTFKQWRFYRGGTNPSKIFITFVYFLLLVIIGIIFHSIA